MDIRLVPISVFRQSADGGRETKMGGKMGFLKNNPMR
jgi:hypothetical protein